MTHPGGGIDFFVRYAELGGALAEPVSGGTLVVLPDPMQSQLQLAEEIGLTEDPEVAREDGYVLLTHGHPLLTLAAESVLAQGDIGWAHLPGPGGPPPTPSLLEARAREEVQPDHGRIDAAGAPQAAHLATLRVGALITYSVSIDQRVQELEEVWVDAGSGDVLPETLAARLAVKAVEPGPPVGMVLPEAAAQAAALADGLLRSRAEQRSAELARQTASRLRSQLAVVDDYYQRVATAIEERRLKAPSERARVLADQAEATQREWHRRRTEVADDLTPSYDVRPFRLHLVAIPAFDLPAVVRRGTRTYPLTLTYVPLSAAFLTPRCPACGTTDTLVARKDRLACRTCSADGAAGRSSGPEDAGAVFLAATSGIVPAEPPPEQAELPLPHPAPPSQADPASSKADRPTRLPPPGAAAGGTHRGKSRRTKPTGRVTPKGTTNSRDAGDAGLRLASTFWETVVGGERWKRHDTVPASPLDALLRLYGAQGPALLLGLRDGERPSSVGISTDTVGPGRFVSSGELATSAGRELPFALHWRSGPRAIAEVEAVPLERFGAVVLSRDTFSKLVRARYRLLLQSPPKPVIPLEATPATLFDHASRRIGLGYAVRCMAAWWYLTEDLAPPGTGPDDPFAPAVESVVTKRAGLKLTATALAADYGCAVEDVRKEARRLQAILRNDPDAGW